MTTTETPTVRAGGSPPSKGAGGAESEPLVLGRYRLGRRLGTGGFGTVYAARDERLDRPVAVKILPRHRVMGARFEREARAAARLSHPAIVTLFEAVVDDDGAYLVSELVKGRTLDEMLERGGLSDRDILEIGIALCDALVHAHDEGVIHRDVKPSNILIPARGRSATHPAKLTDFGVARVVGGDAVTQTGDVVGTLSYMAPEQAEGREAGPAADLYSLALVIYEALTGVNPIRHQRPGTRVRRLATYLPPIRRQRRDLPRQLGAGIDLALRPRPRERGTLHDLRQALVSSLPQARDSPGVVEPASGWLSRTGDHEALDEHEPGPQWRDEPASHTRDAGPQAGNQTDDRDVPQPPPWTSRGLGAAGAGLAAGWLSTHLLTSAPLAPAALAVIAAGAVLLLPRLGWLTSIATLALLAATQHRTGGALMLVLITALSALPLLLSGELWPAPALAVALGLLGLAGAWPAAVGRAGLMAWQRATLAATGFVWLAVAGDLAGHNLYSRPPHPPLATVWTASPATTLHDIVAPLINHGLLAGALVWAVSATILPWLTRGRSVPLDLVVVTVWSAATVSAVGAVVGSAPHAAVIGAVAAGLIACSPHAARRGGRSGIAQ